MDTATNSTPFFFITGLPKTRTEWVANYLTHDRTFCLNGGLKNCSDGVHKLREMFPHNAKYTGNADPANVLFQDKLAEEFPDAKWVLIERNYTDAQREVEKLGLKPDLFVLQSKLEELRGKFSPLVVKYEELNDAIKEIATYVNPVWTHPWERHEMLVDLNVEVDMVKAIKEAPKFNLPVEPVKLSATCVEYMTLVKELCAPDPFAFEWFEQMVHAALVWDHRVDGDAQNTRLFDEVMLNLITDWPLNPFLKRHAEHIMATVASSISAWKFSYQEGAPKEFAYVCYSDIPAAIAFVLGGNQRVQQFMPRIRALVQKMCADDSLRDGGKL